MIEELEFSRENQENKQLKRVFLGVRTRLKDRTQRLPMQKLIGSDYGTIYVSRLCQSSNQKEQSAGNLRAKS